MLAKEVVGLHQSSMPRTKLSGKSRSKCREGLHMGTVAEEGSLRRCHLSESLQEVGGEPGYLHKSMSGRPLRERLGHLQPKGGKAGAK